MEKDIQKKQKTIYGNLVIIFKLFINSVQNHYLLISNTIILKDNPGARYSPCPGRTTQSGIIEWNLFTLLYPSDQGNKHQKTASWAPKITVPYI